MNASAKRCARCGQPKPPESYGRSAQTHDGLRYVCHACTRDYFRDWKARRVAVHVQWLSENGLAARSPGTRVCRGGTLAAVGMQRETV